MRKYELIILIPCFNEEKTIVNICKKASNFGKVIVIDDKSTDNSKNKIKKEKIKFLFNKKNLGYEKTLLKGFRYALSNFKQAKYILTIDADGELPVKNIPKIIKNIKKNNFDLIIGNRSRFNRISEVLLNLFFKIKFGLRDPISGFKLYKIQSLKKIINQISYNYFLVDILLLFNKFNFTMTNLNIDVKQRIDNSRVGNDLMSNLKILRIILKLF